MKKKLVVAKMPVNDVEKIAVVCYEDGKAVELYIRDNAAESILNNIYLGHVMKTVSGGYFVKYDSTNEGFLSSEKCRNAVFKNIKKDSVIRPGDELIVMVEKEAVNNKQPALSTKLTISGRNLVICTDFDGLRFSHRLSDEQKGVLSDIMSDKKYPYGFIVRTSAGDCTKSDLTAEADALTDKMNRILDYGTARPYGTCLYKAGDIWIEKLKGMNGSDTEKIITDIPCVYDEMKSALDKDDLINALELYEDSMVALYRLNNLSALLQEALSERVYLKSGASIVIQRTEAFACIDVNSAKSAHRKTDEEEFLKINLEAASEIVRQIRLRSLSGTILIDFINMKRGENRRRLLEEFKNNAASDPAGMQVIDITPLGIMEITRKRTYSLA